ncbi:MAG TPA: fumarylacetoacetate hydrolase family protein [Trebonia sp.]|jgi:2-keto-4-pentenoate hydratase|nr:fumarylacetoacetate hydrolase family protein [Trebonia sp.]
MEAELASILEQAALTRTAVGKLTDLFPIDVPAAYRVQRENIRRRLNRGERMTGVKLGFSSKAKMAQTGVDEVIWGILTDAMAADAEAYDIDGLIHPKVEPELVFRLGRRVSGTDDAGDAALAVDAVAVGFEVLDSRYEGDTFTLPDVIADNVSVAGFGTGPWHQLAAAPDISDLPVTLSVNGEVVQEGSTKAILGDPWGSLRSAVRLATQAGITFEPGWIVLAGAITEPVPLTPGAHVEVSAGPLESAGLQAR